MVMLQVFDPPLCCSTGVCGPTVDPVLPQFAADLEWLKSQGVAVERFNLAQRPQAFAETAEVRQALTAKGNKCLPLVMVDRQIMSEGYYPSREELAVFVGIETVPANSLYTPGVEALVALGAALGANCEPCFQYHFSEARKAGVSRDDIVRAVATAKKVKEAAADGILKLAGRRLAAERQEEMLKTTPCCVPGTGSQPDAPAEVNDV